MDTADRALLAETVRDAFATRDRSASLDPVLDDLGWRDMLAAEPADALEIVFTALGAANGSATALDDLVVSALGMQPRAGLAALLPPFAAWDPPGRADGDQIHAVGLATARAETADEVLIVCNVGAESRAITVPAAIADITALHGIDPDASLQAVRVDTTVTAGRTLDHDAWEGAVALAQRAIAHQSAGASRAMLDLARTHAVERVQFGRPIAFFQAVRHRLAEALVAIEALEATLTAASDEPGPDTAALAKAVAGQTARTVSAHCQQVLAGVGFTTDHPFHRYLKRTIVLDGLFGSSDNVVLHLGRRLLASRTVPTLIEL
jgi:hypothetical protein